MNDDSKVNKKLQDEIENILTEWEKNNSTKKGIHNRMLEDMSKYTKEGLDVQKKKFDDNVDRVVKINDMEECEEFINNIAKDISEYISINEAHPIMRDMVIDLKSETNKFNQEYLEQQIKKKTLTKEQLEKALKLENEEKQLRELITDDFDIMTERVFPLQILSSEKRSFLWNLTSWKFNILLTKQMKKYTFWVMMLTIFIVVLTIILVILSFLN